MARRRKRAHPYLWTVVAAVLAVVWVGSYWISIYGGHAPTANEFRSCWVAGGAAGYYSIRTPSPIGGLGVGWLRDCHWISEQGRNWYWLPGYRFDAFGGRISRDLWVPLWPAVAVANLFAVVHWRRARRVHPGSCPSCGYSRAGLAADAVCPECGAAGAAPPPREASA
jgi:hypothetical protein